MLSDVPGYSETFFMSKIRSLSELNHKVILFAHNKSRKFDLCEVVVSPRVPSSQALRIVFVWRQFFLLLLRCPKRLIRFVRLEKATGRSWSAVARNVCLAAPVLPVKLAWLHFGFGTMALGRENIARAIGARMAVSFRGFDHYIFPVKNPGAYDMLVRLADRFHVLSQHMKQDLIDQGVKPEHVSVISPAIEVEKFQGPRESTGNVVRIITVARLHWVKGLEYTLEAMRILKDKGLDFHFTIVGDGKERERIMYAGYQLGLSNHVTFAGKKSPIEVISLLRQSEIYVQYSIQEGFCNAVLEAQAAGLLCIVSDADGLTENVVNGQTGWVVPRRKPAELASTILDVVNASEEQRAVIRNAAGTRVRDCFHIRHQKRAFAEFYEL